MTERETIEIKQLADTWNQLSIKLMDQDSKSIMDQLHLGGGSDMTYKARTTAKEIISYLQEDITLIKLITADVSLFIEFIRQNNTPVYKQLNIN